MANYKKGYSDKLMGISNNIGKIVQQKMNENIDLLLAESKKQLSENYKSRSGELLSNERIVNVDETTKKIINKTPYASILNSKKPWRSKAIKEASSKILKNYRDGIKGLLSR